MRVRARRKHLADRFEDRAAREHEIGALRPDAAIGDALVEIHGAQRFDGAGGFRVGHPQAVDAPAVVAFEPQMNARERCDRARGAEKMEA